MTRRNLFKVIATSTAVALGVLKCPELAKTVLSAPEEPVAALVTATQTHCIAYGSMGQIGRVGYKASKLIESAKRHHDPEEDYWTPLD
jgi:hypothetical protein